MHSPARRNGDGRVLSLRLQLEKCELKELPWKEEVFSLLFSWNREQAAAVTGAVTGWELRTLKVMFSGMQVQL